VLLPEGVEPDEIGMLRTDRNQSPVVNDTPVRRARQYLREAEMMRASLAQGAGDAETQAELKRVIPNLALIANHSTSERTRIQATEALRQMILFLENKEDRNKAVNGDFSFENCNVQINVNRGGDGPIVSMGES